MDRRQFSFGMPALLGVAALHPNEAPAQAAPPGPMPTLTSGTHKPGEPHEAGPGRMSRDYVIGMLAAGNIRLAMHETMQKPGAEHEPVGTHLHNEIWRVQHGTASLFINGTEHTMEAGDIGLVCAGDRHWIKNIGKGELAYFVIALGPPE